ncbi:Partitioning defective 6 likeeta [Schistosoma japonicum]|nr:Partitioning defective 6 likeeta [Schistosoma japonicum]
MYKMSIGRLVEVKSKFDAEFRRFSFLIEDSLQYNAFYSLLERIHMLFNIPFVIQYVEPKNADLLPISNNKNFEVAVNSSKSLLRILLQRKGESYGEIYGYKTSKHSLIHRGAANTLRNFGGSGKHRRLDKPIISVLSDFHLVSSILDVDIIPWTLRRVHLVRTPGKQFGLHIRTGAIQYYTKNGYETVPAFFISRLTEDGIAYNTGLLAVNDEIIEVNGIEVYGKSLDQVNDMMVANSSNLIITIRPADQSMCLAPKEISRSRFSQSSDLLYGPRKNIPMTGRNSPLLTITTSTYGQSQPYYLPSQSSSAQPANVTSTMNHNPLIKTGISNGESKIQVNEEIESDDDMNVGLITI